MARVAPITKAASRSATDVGEGQLGYIHTGQDVAAGDYIGCSYFATGIIVGSADGTLTNCSMLLHYC